MVPDFFCSNSIQLTKNEVVVWQAELLLQSLGLQGGVVRACAPEKARSGHADGR